MVALFTAPVVFLRNTMLLLGSDGDDPIWGIVMLVLFLPVLIALHRRARPRP